MTELDKKLAKAARECSAVVLMVATSATLPLLGGVKYWDNPAFKAFDVGDYAPGAVWHFDGIRNVGADQPHSTTTTTWKNIGSTGSSNDVWIRYLNAAGSGWANSSAPASLGIVNGRNLGSWTENGFVFTGDSEWRAASPASIGTGTNYTLQALVDAKISGQTRNNPHIMSVNSTDFAFYINKSDARLSWRTLSGNLLSIYGDKVGYMTAILNGTDNTATFFSGTTVPTTGSGFKQFESVSGKNESGYCIGGYTGSDGAMVGTYYSYRYYKRVLSREELMWNRVVDEARFFGRVAPLPVTNVVVASTFPRVGGTEPVGRYAIESDGHTFTVPAATNVAGRAYTCTGYTLETWDGTAWSAPVAHDGELSYTLSDPTALVRLTWQWEAGDGLVTYDMDDYVWDGLLWFYDGIQNVGRDKPHDPTSLNWVNLGSAGPANDLFLQRVNEGGTDFVRAQSLQPVEGRNPGQWTERGFAFAGDSRFRSTGSISAGTSYSLQALVDVKSSLLKFDPSYLLSIAADRFTLRFGKTSGKIIWGVQGTDYNLYASNSSANHDYVTAILNGANLTAALFCGTNAPTSGTMATGFYQFETLDPFADTAYCIGAVAYSTVAQMRGELKFFRYYDHALSDEEVARNRVVDDFRYFGRSPVTNVLVATTCPYLQGNEKESAYEVVGAYTFTAPAFITAKGITYTNDGYTVETWSGSAWGGCSAYAGTSYAYTTTAGKVRLTWKWKPVRGLRTAADYSFDDYSQAGLVWNYDGICNLDRYLEHSTNTTTWCNLGSGGSAFNLARTRMSDGDLGEWTANGYEFRDHTRFKSGAAVGPLKSFTCQTLMEASADNQTHVNSYVMSAIWDCFSWALHEQDGTGLAGALVSRVQGNNILSLSNTSRTYDYMTTILDYDAKTAALFDGVVPPTTGSGFLRLGSVSPRSTTGYGLGSASTASDTFVGTIKSFRYYDRVLTQEELVRNRNVDAVRYFGALGVTNVYVAAGGGVQAETGACKVEGSWTFTATSVEKKNGQITPVTRYTVERLVNGAWTDATWHDGASYTYVEGTDPESVRLTWHGRPEGAVILVR